MNYRLTHALVGIVAAALVAGTLAFGFVITGFSRNGAGAPPARSAIPLIAHPVNESMADCLRCHATGQEGMPPSHATYGAATCLTCHQVATAGALVNGASPTAMPAGLQSPVATPSTAATPAPVAAGQATESPSPSGGAGPVPHPVTEPYVDCVGCHVIGGNLSMPQNHAGYTNAVCTGCHAGPALEEAAAAGSKGGTAPAVPHEVSGPYADCTSCHAPGNGSLAVPENHAGFTNETCTNCHKKEH